MAVDKELTENFDRLFEKLDILCDSLEQKIKEREEKNMLINKNIKLGNEIYLTDPCYDITTWCQQLVNNVKSGNWVVDYEYNEYKDGAEQEVILSIAHEDYGMTIFNENGLAYLEKKIVPSLKEGDYYTAVKTYADCAQELLEMAAQGKPFNKRQHSTQYILGVIAGAILLPLLLAYFMMKKKLAKMKRG